MRIANVTSVPSCADHDFEVLDGHFHFDYQQLDAKDATKLLFFHVIMLHPVAIIAADAGA